MGALFKNAPFNGHYKKELWDNIMKTDKFHIPKLFDTFKKFKENWSSYQISQKYAYYEKSFFQYKNFMG